MNRAVQRRRRRGLLFGGLEVFWSAQVFGREPMAFRDDALTAASDQRDICWSGDGTRIFALDRGDDIVRQADVGEPFSVASGLTSSGSTPFNAASGTTHGLAFRPDGLQCYIFQRTAIRAYNLATAWDVTTMIDDIVAVVDVTAPGISRGHGISFGRGGQYLYIDCRQNTSEDDPPAIYQWEMSTPWDISTLSFVDKYEVPAHLHSAQRGNQISLDGKRMFTLQVGSSTLWEFALATPWMISTARPAAAIDLMDIDGVTAGIATNIYGFEITPDGRSVALSETNGRISQIEIEPRLADHGPLSTEMRWEYDTSLGSGTTVQINVRSPRPADHIEIDWGDGTVETLPEGSGSEQVYSHEYAEDGVYEVTLTGGAGGIVLAQNAATRDMLTRVLDWGDGIGWRNFGDVARDCPNLTEVPENWPVSVRSAGDASTGSVGRGALMNSPIGSNAVIAHYDLRALIQAQGTFSGVGEIIFPVDWELPNARSARAFLANTPFNQRLDNLSIRNVIDARTAFNTGFDNDSPKNWDWRSVTNAAGMFPTMSTENYDAILIAIAAFGAELQSGVAFGAGSSTYSTAAAAARDYLVTEKGWTITDGGPE